MLVRCEPSEGAVPLWFVTKETWPKIKAGFSEAAQVFATSCGFEPAPGRYQILPSSKGRIESVVFGLEPEGARARDLFLPGQLAALLPSGIYHFANSPYDLALAAVSWALSGYRFGRYNADGSQPPMLCVPDGVDADRVERIVRGVTFGRDLINTPANDMDPEALETAVLSLASQYKAKATVIRGDELVHANLPLIYAVGQAAAKPPRLAEFRCGNKNRPKVTLVGKGVSFDTGGLDIKPESAMALMKKDMGGAAAALAIASMIMDAELPVRLRGI